MTFPFLFPPKLRRDDVLCKIWNTFSIDQFSSHKTSRWLRTGETKIKKSRANDPYWYLLFLVTTYLAKKWHAIGYSHRTS